MDQKQLEDLKLLEDHTHQIQEHHMEILENLLQILKLHQIPIIILQIGGNGWYSGAGRIGFYHQTAGAGGSGFIIGVSTTTYPSGYLGDDTNLQATIASAISEGTLTQGGSTETKPKMVLTILSLPNSTRNIHYYNGTQFVEAEVYRYNGTLFERVEPKIYTNSQWQ